MRVQRRGGPGWLAILIGLVLVLAACTADDVEQVEAWFACTEAAGATACEPSTGALDAALDCVSELDGLSDACDVGRTGPLGG